MGLLKHVDVLHLKSKHVMSVDSLLVAGYEMRFQFASLLELHTLSMSYHDHRFVGCHHVPFLLVPN
jgi:hypothetical protein